MDGLLKIVVTQFYNLLPWRIKQIILDIEIENTGPFSVINRVAALSNVDGLAVSGNYGVFVGSAHDECILANYAEDRVWAQRTNKLIESYFKTVGGGSYVDIGANIGLTTIPIASNKNVFCYCFEPDPNNYKFLKMNVQTNCRFENTKLFNLAVFSCRSELEFEKSATNSGDHRIRVRDEISKLGENSREVIKVNAVSLDEILSGVRSPLVVKVDTQGAEPYVILGGGKVLERAGMVILEFSPYMMKRMNSDVDVYLDFISAYSKVGIATGETDEVGSYLSGHEAAIYLKDFYEENNSKSMAGYCDVICLRE